MAAEQNALMDEALAQMRENYEVELTAGEDSE